MNNNNGCGCSHNDEEMNKCGCEHDHEHGCGCDHEEHEGCGCGCGHDHEHEHDASDFVVDLEDENGNTISCPVIDAFEYKEGNYVLARNVEDDSVFMFKYQGEELVVPDEEEFDEVANFYNNVLVNEEE